MRPPDLKTVIEAARMAHEMGCDGVFKSLVLQAIAQKMQDNRPPEGFRRATSKDKSGAIDVEFKVVRDNPRGNELVAPEKESL